MAALCNAMMNLIGFLCSVIFTRGSHAALHIIQGRIINTPQASVEMFPVIGIATVAIDNQITNYFDCVTDLTSNNGSGIRWVVYGQRFTVHPITDVSGLPGKRLNLPGITIVDLGMYTCWDSYSGDVTNITITDANPAIMVAQEGPIGVVEGSSAVLEVYVSGYPEQPMAAQMTWHRPEGSEVDDKDQGVEFQEGRRRLVLFDLQQQQAGVYRCEVESQHHSASAQIQLNIYVPPTFLTHPEDIADAPEWSPVTLTCSVSGIPQPSIWWEREGGAQLPVENLMLSLILTNETTTTTASQLHLATVRYDDRGRYRCVADNFKTNATASDYANITVSPMLRFADDRGWLSSDLYFVVDESRVSLECFGAGILRWNSSTDLEISLNRSADVYSSYDHTRDALALVIQNFTTSYTAVYTCTSDLTVLGGSPLSSSLLITSSHPAVFIQPTVQYVPVGNSTTIEATVHAFPADSAVVQWYHNATLINTSNETGYSTSTTQDGSRHRLEIDSVSESELGEYVIVVSIDGANATDEIILKFHVPPLIMTSTTEGDEATTSLEISTESTTSSINISNSSTESDSHSPSPTFTLPRIGAIVSGLISGIVLIFLVEIIICCVYKAYMHHVHKINN